MGNLPAENEISASLVRRTAKIEWQDLRSETGIMSIDEGFDNDRIRVSAAAVETGEKVRKGVGTSGGGTKGKERLSEKAVTFAKIKDSLSLKNTLNISAVKP